MSPRLRDWDSDGTPNYLDFDDDDDGIHDDTAMTNTDKLSSAESARPDPNPNASFLITGTLHARLENKRKDFPSNDNSDLITFRNGGISIPLEHPLRECGYVVLGDLRISADGSLVGDISSDSLVATSICNLQGNFHITEQTTQ